jgi:hypothetical protein
MRAAFRGLFPRARRDLDVGDIPLGLPRKLLGTTRTLGWLRMRLTFPVDASVRTYSLPCSMPWLIGLGMASPDRLNVTSRIWR